jgi:hypothetical protein
LSPVNVLNLDLLECYLDRVNGYGQYKNVNYAFTSFADNEMLEKGEIKLVGGIHEISTGAVTFDENFL